MTTVVFTLKDLEGVPIPNTVFTITAGLPDEAYDPEVVVPPEQTFTRSEEHTSELQSPS